MKLLLDENLPKRLKPLLMPHQAHTVRDMGWNGKSNGALLALMKENKFQCLLTFDKNLRFQQNFDRYDIPVLVLDAPDNTFLTLQHLVPRILHLLDGELQHGPTIIHLA